MPAAVRPGQRGVKVLRSGRSPRAQNRVQRSRALPPSRPAARHSGPPGRLLSTGKTLALQNTEEKQSRTERT